MADSDDELTLSASTLDVLKAFYSERDEHARRFAELKAAAETAADQRQAGGNAAAPLSMSVFGEDWNKSQFWYSDETASLLARQLLEGTDASSLVGVISAPSVFVALKNIINTLPEADRPRLILLEHDDRFELFGDEFIFYDYNLPTKLPPTLRGAADRIVCDPPFLNEDCQTKAALTARWMSRPDARIVVCTGERMQEIITTKLYNAQGVRTTTFEPEHASGLSNEFYCYANFEGPDWTWRKSEA